MQIQTLGIVIANAIVVLCAVWRLSGLLAEMKTQLAHVIKDHAEDNAAVNARLNAHEARLLNLERGK